MFFVTGLGKSGTSWLMRTLDGHPDILCKGEGRFFAADWRRANFDPEGTQAMASSLYYALLHSEYLRMWVERSVWAREDDAARHLDNLTRLATEEVKVSVVHAGVGGITESDVMLAAASDAVILGFNVRPVGDARAAAEREGVEIRTYSVIYKVIEELRKLGVLVPDREDSTATGTAFALLSEATGQLATMIEAQRSGQERDDAVLIAASIFLDIFNIFLLLLDLFGGRREA